MLIVSQRKEVVTTAFICILITDILCAVARNVPSVSFYKGRGRGFSTSHTKICQRIFAERQFWIHSGRSWKENIMLKLELFRDFRRLFLCQPPHTKHSKFTNGLCPQVMEATSMHQAAARQFKSMIQNMLIAVNFVICFICSTVFLLNCFLLAYLLKLSIPAPFPRSPVKGLTRLGSLILNNETGPGMIATSFILPSQQLHLTDFLAATSFLEPPRHSRAAASMLT